MPVRHGASRPPSGEPAPSPQTVLLISGDPALAALLSTCGVTVERDVHTAPAVVLLDLDGSAEPAGARVAHTRAAHPDALVLAVGEGNPGRAVAEALRAGASDWIFRPLDRCELARALDAALLRQNLGRQGRNVLEFLQEQGRRVEEERRRLTRRIAAMGEELEAAHAELAGAHRALRARVAQLAMLYRIGRDLSHDHNWDAALARLLASLREFLVARGAGLLLASSGGRRLALRSADALDGTVVERATRLLLRSGLQRHREPYLYPLEQLERETPLPCVDHAGPWDVTVLPLQRGEEVLGFLLLDKPYAGSAAIAEDLHFLITIQTILTEEVAGAQAFFELQRLQGFQERTLDQVESGIITLTGDGGMVYANRKARDLLAGLPEPEGVAHALRVGTDGVPLLTWLLAQADEGSAQGEGWLAGAAAQGPIPLALRASRWRGEAPGQTYHVVILEDQRATRRLEAERRRAARQQELLVMAAEWAHDVRTPLTGILHSAELLAEASGATGGRDRHLQVIRGEVDRLNGLVSNFLDFARPVRLERRPADLADVAAGAVELMQAKASQRAVTLALAPPAGGGLMAEVDVDQIKQVLLNLIDNALDASPPGRAVVVEVRRDPPSPTPLEAVVSGPGIALVVVDEGSGVSAEHIERLFVPFFTTKTKGNGLGLAISEKIVRGHGGHLRYERREGRTYLWALLPAAVPAGAATETLQARG
jgi:signal transduction histidine kinase/FixJ family two-component response regulator